MDLARELMAGFLARTHRYLWTDAFAVCNLIGFGELAAARSLIDRVHEDLGRHRPDDSRVGWISGLAEADGADHPTIGGLRIGKPLPDHGGDDRFDWDRDGQYFHYLTKWMHALDQAARALGDPELATWSRELAETAHDRFVYGPAAHRRMYWKLSIDLSRPLVESMGQHDPLDGYVTSLQLAGDIAMAADYRSMVDPGGLVTLDPLGIGGLLCDAYRLAQLDQDRPLRDAILAAARAGLGRFIEQRPLSQPPDHRLAFRELGLAIGLAAAEAMAAPGFSTFQATRDAIVAFWSEPTRRRAGTYLANRDINDVMLATSFAPRGFLVLGGRGR